MGAESAYGLWILVAINSAIVIAFAISFFHPHTGRDWRAMGAFSAFLVALFTEMYGFPLTIYLLSGWLGSRFPAIVPTHAGGHLFNDLIGWQWDPHLSPFHLASYALIGGGFWLMASAWRVLWRAQREGRLATDGPYASIRHPQYTGLALVMLGFLLQWPTLLTLAMFPVMLAAYFRLATSEEREVESRFSPEWEAYAESHPRFIPHLRALIHSGGIPRRSDDTAG
jgi:protein-S-isoprenylcysteine O-methyltransferase Ste14